GDDHGAIPGRTAPGDIRGRLADRTRQILERPRPSPDPDHVEQEKAVVHECRYLMRLLASRRRSAGEMRERLRQREVPGAIAHEGRYLMRRLASRRRAAGEMRGRLRPPELPGAIAHEAVARSDRAGLIDDESFAREWVQQRRARRALGDEALRRELEAKQVD